MGAKQLAGDGNEPDSPASLAEELKGRKFPGWQSLPPEVRKEIERRMQEWWNRFTTTTTYCGRADRFTSDVSGYANQIVTTHHGPGAYKQTLKTWARYELPLRNGCAGYEYQVEFDSAEANQKGCVRRKMKKAGFVPYTPPHWRSPCSDWKTCSKNKVSSSQDCADECNLAGDKCI